MVIDPTKAGDAVAGRKIAAVLQGWADVRSAREELGARGRCAYVERYDHRLSCAAFEGIVRSVWGTPPRVGQDAACIEVRANSLLAPRGSTRS